MGDSCRVVHDVVIVGAGPCGLAVAARLCEHTPSAIFTDEEHHRYHWIKKHANRATIKNKRTGQVTGPKAVLETCRNYSTLVLDGSGNEWMAKWNRLFKTFDISHLRSPMFFHPDPHDRDGMLAFAHTEDRVGELVEIPECVGKEISKHKKKKRARCPAHRPRPPTTIDERDRKDYYTPSCSLFKDYCERIIDRYGLRSNLIRQETLKDINFGAVPYICGDSDLFTLHTDKGVHFARTVVLAVGPGNTLSLPKELSMGSGQGACHAMQIERFPDGSVIAKMRERKVTNVMVVGGGLTSAQITDMAIRHGVSKVWQLVRGSLKVKPFDVDLNWMGKFNNHEKCTFLSADSDDERLLQIKSARGGGSVTSRYHKILKQHIATDRLSMHQSTSITSQTYCHTTQTWTVSTNPNILDLPPIDYIYFATGVESDFRTLPFLQTLNANYPIDAYGGLPALNDDLMWKDDVPLFVTGRLAALRLGPGAGNLEGARVGAERVAWAIEDVLSGHYGGGEHINDQEYRYGAGIGSRFDSLVLDNM